AMLILTCPAQLQRLEGALRRSLPLALPVHGAVMNMNRGNPGDFEAVVDAWPDFHAVPIPAPQVPADDCYMNMHAAFYRDLGAYRALLESPGALHWDTAFHIFGGARGGGRWGGQGSGTQGAETGVQCLLRLTDAPPCRLDPGVRVGSLSPAHADLLDATWAYGGNAWSRRYLADMVARFPSLCLLTATATQPLCWVLLDPFGTAAHGYTLPTHRRRGHMRALTVLAARQAQARGFPAFGHTAPDNRPMQRLQERVPRGWREH
uniref:Glycine N-acyltransferase-like protein n=1 Tax=Dromaius novaehollandiae TaxID=8790 RepID=A0A8C4KLJ2_DRONO